MFFHIFDSYSEYAPPICLLPDSLIASSGQSAGFVSLHSCPFPSFSLEKVAIPGYSSRLPLNGNAYKLPNSTLRLLAPHYHRRPCLILPANVSLDNNGEIDLQGEGGSHWPLATGLEITDPTLPCRGEEMLFGCRPSSLYFPQSLY